MRHKLKLLGRVRRFCGSVAASVSARHHSNTPQGHRALSTTSQGDTEERVLVPKHLSLTEYIFEDADKYGNKPALIDDQTGLTIGFEQLQEEIRTLSSALYHLGVRQRETVTLCCTNTPYLVHVMCGVTENGATLSLASPRLDADGLASQLRQSRSRYVIVTPNCAETAIKACFLSPYTEGVLSIGEVAGCRPLLKLFGQDHPPHPRVHINPDSTTALLPFSRRSPGTDTDTRGSSRGVMLGHTNITSTIAQLRHQRCLPLEPNNDVSLVSTPWVEMSTLVLGVCLPLSLGVTVVSQSSFNHQHFLKAVQKHRATFSLLSPAVMNFLGQHPMVDHFDLTSLTTPICEAGSLSESVTNALMDRLKLQGLRQAYGSTETCSTTHVTQQGGWKDGYVGEPLPLTKCKVLDPVTGAPVGVREKGELCIRGPQVMRGYSNNPRATQHAFTHDGWLKTGDLGYYNEDGEYYIVGKLMDREDSQFSPNPDGVWKLHPLASGIPAIGLPFKTLEEVPTAL